MIQRLLLVFCLAFSGLTAYGQTALGGKITDADSGEELMFATIQLIRDGQMVVGTQTDFDGNYNFAAIDPGTYTARVSYTGYTTQDITGVVVRAGQYNQLNVQLSSGVTIDEIVVTEYRVPLIDIDNTTQGGTITAEEIQNLPSRDVNAIAATTAGVASADDGSALNIRGSRSDATDYYVDGVRVRGALVPNTEIEQMQIITGGVPAQYGDVMGGVISITTRGPSNRFGGMAEFETSQFLDAYGYNLASANISGPLLRNSDGKSIMGYRLNAQIRLREDRFPSAVGAYKVRDEVFDDLSENPLEIRPGLGLQARAQYLTDDQVERVRAQPNYGDQLYQFGGRLDFQLTEAIDLSIGGSYRYIDRKFIPANSWRLLNFPNNPSQILTDYRFNARFRHRIGGNPVDRQQSTALIQNAMYSIQIGFDRSTEMRSHPEHGDNFFRYGYIGDFDQSFDISSAVFSTTFVEDSIMGVMPVIEHVGYNRRLNGYTPNYDINPGLVRYNELLTDYSSLDDFVVFNGFRNDVYFDIYALHANVNTPYNTYAKGNTNTYSLNVRSSFEVVPQAGSNTGRHSIEFGVLYEQRVDRFYALSPANLWFTARNLANSHFDGLDHTLPIADSTFIIGNFPPINVTIYDNLARDSVWAAANDGTSQQTRFDWSLRRNFGFDRTTWINVDGLHPDDISLDFFSAGEIDERFINYYGFDYLGNPLSGDITFDDFFTMRDDRGDRFFPVAPVMPIYTAAYIQDRFRFRDIIFRVGLRIDRYDANTKVMRDPYSLYRAYNASEFHSLDARQGMPGQPATVGDDFMVYVDNPNSSLEMQNIRAYRDGDVWYNSQGTRVNDPSQIFGGEQALPALINGTTQDITDSDFDINETFVDYRPEVNIMPRLAFSFPIADGRASFFAHYDVLAQRPSSNTIATPLDYYNFFRRATSGIFNNPDLKSQKTVDYEVGFQQQLSQSSALKIAAYYKELRDMIQSKYYFYAYPIPYEGFGNEDFATVKGLTLQYDMRRTNNLQMMISYTLQFADGTGSGSQSQRNLATRGLLRTIYPLDFDERHRIVGRIDYRYGSGPRYNGPRLFGMDILENFGANFIVTTVSGRPFTETLVPRRLGGSGTVGSLNGARLPWTFRIDMRLDKDFAIGDRMGINVFLRVQNLLDTRNLLGVYTHTMSPDDDGFLNSSDGRSQLNAQPDPDAFLRSYQWRLLNPGFYSLPRRVFLGANLMF